MISIDSTAGELLKKTLQKSIDDLQQLIDPKQQENDAYNAGLAANTPLIDGWKAEQAEYQALLDDVTVKVEAEQAQVAPDPAQPVPSDTQEVTPQ